ncbi:MAG: hypothetical protein GC147_12345 [Porphyrobacter sp.]|nr:hypothetical protein [Porphyrobacter sp.]
MKVQVEGDWNGWGGETLVELTNGCFYRQDEYLYEYRYSYRPVATLEGRMLHVEGMSRAVRVREIDPIVANVVGEWSGWDGSTTVELTNGQVWEQAAYKYEYKYAYRPRVIIDGDEMFVDGMSGPVRVRRK